MYGGEGYGGNEGLYMYNYPHVISYYFKNHISIPPRKLLAIQVPRLEFLWKHLTNKSLYVIIGDMANSIAPTGGMATGSGKVAPSRSRAPAKSRKKGRVIKKGEPIIVPNKEAVADVYGEEEIERLKHNEKQRRNMARQRGGVPTVPLTSQEIKEMEAEEMITMAKQTRNLSLGVLEAALMNIMSDPEKLAKTNVATLATVFGIMYDKTQLMQGLSTQNIAINAKVDINMDSDKAIEELNKMRSKFQEANDS